MNLESESHPYNFQEPIPDGTRFLIVGTAPPPRFSTPRSNGGRREEWDVDFYYGSGSNYLWVFLDNIAFKAEGKLLLPEQLSAEQCRDEMRSFLRRHKIWMHDVLQTYRRNPGKEDSASDNDIVPPPNAKFTNFRTVLEVKSILKLAFTSEMAAEWTLLALEEQQLLTNPEHYKAAYSYWRNIDRGLPIEKYIERKFKQPFAQGQIANRDFCLYVLPSPTARAPIEGLTLCRKRDIYECVLFRP